MKKFHIHLLIAIFTGVIAVLLEGLTAMSLHAYATDTTLSYTIERLAGNDADYSAAQPGDYKITLNIANNAGVNACALLLTYDATNFTIFDEEVSTGTNEETGESFTYSTIPVVEHYAQFGVPLATTFSYAPGIIRFLSVAPNTSYRNGEAFSIYLRPNANCTSITPLLAVNVVYWKVGATPETLTDVPVSVISTVNTEYHYLVGDVDGDGEITEFDAQIVDGVLDANGGTISATDFEEDVPFYAYDGVVCIGVVDVDNDGDIDAADGQEILRYHVVTEVMNGTYTGNVGTTGYLYATEIVSLARTSNGN